jgi:hypothetical protein
MNGGGNDGTLANGTVSLSGVILPGGTYNVTAHYAGDGTFAPSDSAGVPITVNKESSRLQVGIVLADPISGNLVSTNATSFAYGAPYVLRMDILNSSGNPCQPLVSGGVTTGCAFDATGSVTVTDNGTRLDAGVFPINSEGHAEDQPIQLLPGPHALLSTYSGDNSYSAPAAAVATNLTVTKATTTTSVTASPTSITSGTMVTLTATIVTQSNGAAPTGTVQFLNGATPIAGTVTLTGKDGAQSSTGFASLTATLTTTISAFTVPHGPAPRAPQPGLPLLMLACLSMVSAYLAMRLAKNRGRGLALASLILAVGLATTFSACGGGSSAPSTKTVTINAQYAGDVNYASSSGQASITVQ